MNTKFFICIFTAVVALALGKTALAETWTGCVTPGGTIVHMAQGDTPRKSCAKNHRLIHLSDRASKQSTETVDPDGARETPGAIFDHELACLAWEEAGTPPGTLNALGCPTGSEPLPVGETIQIIGNTIDESPLELQSCINSVVPGEEVGAEDACFTLEKAFIGRQFQVANLGLEDNLDSACRNACETDNRCFLAWLERPDSQVQFNPSLACHLFYRSENVGLWQHLCSGYRGGVEDCIRSGLRATNFFWYRQEQSP